MNVSLWDLKESIKSEQAAKANIEKSCKKWEDILSEISKGVTNICTSSHEWQIRLVNK